MDDVKHGGIRPVSSQAAIYGANGLEAAYDARAAKERRERIATAVLCGWVSHPGRVSSPAPHARIAIEYADALIAELEK